MSTKQSWFDLIKLSLNGEEQDYTKGSIPRAVFLLAIPMILELSLESVFALVDMYFVGRLGENAVAVVGLTESVITIIYSVAIGLSTGATAMVARRVGEKNNEAAAEAGAKAIMIGLALTVVISVVGVYYADQILGLMGAQPDVIEQGAVFTRVMLGGSAAIMLLFLINGIFRGAGNAAIAMKSLWIASVINIILCPIFIQWKGIEGAAWATVVGRSTGVLYQLYQLFSNNGKLKFHLSQFLPEKKLMTSIIQLSWPATFQFIIASGSWIVLAKLVADTGGTEATAGYQIAIRNVVFFILPAWGLSNAAATLVGQNLGAKETQRAEKSVMLTVKYNIIFMSIVSLIFLLFGKTIISQFSDKPSIIAYGAESLRIIALGYIFYGIGMVMTQALNGAGDTKTPTYINFFGFWCFQIPLAYFLAYTMDLKATGAFIAIPVAETAIALMAFYFFKRGKWKSVEV